ncbi:uncharacterized protein [Prorops nasuta]|uniref:uncharacterized protein n=1 Tax=Prorops nasuta TaxID=863751 RepID=UPI0034CFBFD3
MNFLWAKSLIWMIAVNNIARGVSTTTTESSAEYLQKVMIELQQLNIPGTQNTYEQRLAASRLNYRQLMTGANNQQQHNRPAVGKISVVIPSKASIFSDLGKKVHNFQVSESSKLHDIGGIDYSVKPTESVVLPDILSADKADLEHGLAESSQQYYQVRASAPSPAVLGYTRAELATMYKNALEKGSAVSLASLTNALQNGKTPKVTSTHLELPSVAAVQPMYQYYFFPFKTFAAELQKSHGYKTIPTSVGQYVPVVQAAASEESPKQVSNPLFVAISTFVAMALLFMMGILFLPKIHFGTFGAFQARGMQDDLELLSNIIATAIQRYDHRLNNELIYSYQKTDK